jgi:hypothetical protein
MDKAYMVLAYPRASPDPGASQWTTDYALQIIGADSATAQAVKAAYAQSVPDVAAGRQALITFLVNVRPGVAPQGSFATAPSPAEVLPGSNVTSWVSFSPANVHSLQLRYA